MFSTSHFSAAIVSATVSILPRAPVIRRSGETFIYAPSGELMPVRNEQTLHNFLDNTLHVSAHPLCDLQGAGLGLELCSRSQGDGGRDC